ncbi:MAG: bifunctional glutamate N-acetyltransferase/amino-acid acetyltransferase ArgJ [Chloroflexota bacterium]|nr:bifunctional glutamate N-acetyltransferase/amino-acid acetyltransferase ArgJ [Chloroflexota bacterium]
MDRPGIEVAEGDVTAAQGFLAGGDRCGLKPSGRKDVGGVLSERPATAAGTFTTNKVKAAPVLLCQEVLGGTAQGAGHVRAIVFNSGNANAMTGAAGLENARRMQRAFAEGPGVGHGLRPEEVFVASTGVIGVPLDMGKLVPGIRALSLSREGGTAAVEAMMTTDTVPKTAAAHFSIVGAAAASGAAAAPGASAAAGGVITVAGMAKGAAMIAPHMATMLAFIGTDAAVEGAYLQRALLQAVQDSFNMIVIDGDMSTNDTTLLLANGAAWPAGREPLDGSQPECASFEGALRHVCFALAQGMARDGEGATKLVEVRVEGAADVADARRVARAIAGSSLLKAAVLGADPNWGRIACAAGYAEADLDPERLEVSIGQVRVVQSGLAADYDQAAAAAEMQGREVRFAVHLHLGSGSATAWGCDLTPEYVRLNSDYTT